jgi:hypothetical protein
MPAPTTDTIFRLEDSVVTALVAAFNADATLGAIAFGPRKLEELPKSRLDVAALGFSKASEQMIYAAGSWWDSHFTGEVALTVITPRGSPDQAALHSTRVGRVRYLMTPAAQILTATNLPHATVASIDAGQASYEFDPATDTDRTELPFAIQLNLNPSAFP